MWLIGFYTPLIPNLYIHGMVALFLTYWMDKVFKKFMRQAFNKKNTYI